LHIVIIGNGPAGTSAANKIKKLIPETDVTLISNESYPYYARPRLPEFIADKINIDNITVYKREWYAENKINLLLNMPIQTIDINKQTIRSDQENLVYDKLLLATGANAFLPPIKGSNNNNVFTLRTIDDAIKIKEAAKNINEVILIGGGLLGLELANVFTNQNKIIKVIEIAPTLLVKQLEEQRGKKLQQILENRGFEFYLSDFCDMITYNNNKLTAVTSKKNHISGDIILISAGTKPEIILANQAGLKTGKGIIVNQYLQTSNPNIYAAGDCIQYENKMWGFVKSAIEQGNLAAENMVYGNQKIYTETKIEVSLKVTNIDLNLL
jgi:nitrite reductase (NADH) large subunit